MKGSITFWEALAFTSAVFAFLYSKKRYEDQKLDRKLDENFYKMNTNFNTQLRDLKTLQNDVQFIKEKVRKIEERPNKS
jgi:hypothetical protein